MRIGVTDVFVDDQDKARAQTGNGGTDAVFEDGCGNLLNLHQD